MTDYASKRNTGGRPRIEDPAERRDTRVSLALNSYETMILLAKLRRTKKVASAFCRDALLRADIDQPKYDSFLKDIDRITVSEFARMVCLSVTLSEALQDEERKALMGLHKLGQRVNQLFRQGGLRDDVDARAEYHTFLQEFRKIKDYFNDKIARI